MNNTCAELIWEDGLKTQAPPHHLLIHGCLTATSQTAWEFIAALRCYITAVAGELACRQVTSGGSFTFLKKQNKKEIIFWLVNTVNPSATVAGRCKKLVSHPACSYSSELMHQRPVQNSFDSRICVTKLINWVLKVIRGPRSKDSQGYCGSWCKTIVWIFCYFLFSPPHL